MEYSKGRDRRIWDCNSSLYDSFELISFKHQLDSAILTYSGSRCLSMPRLSDPDPNQLLTSQAPNIRRRFKFSTSVQKLIRSLFRPKTTGSNKHLSAADGGGGLAAIPEHLPAKACVHDFPTEFEFGSGSAAVRKTVSERFTRSVDRSVEAVRNIPSARAPDSAGPAGDAL